MKNQSEKQGIVLNRMYAGSYLSSNLGHEVINMYQADNDHYYLYLNHHGAFAKEHAGKIKKMILVKYHSEGVVEVVGVADGLTDVFVPFGEKSVDYLQILPKQKDFIEKDKVVKVSYGKKSLLEIFKGSDYQNVFITYEAKKIWRRKSDKRLFICFSGKKLEGLDTIEVKANQAKTSLKQYFYSDNDDFNALNEIFDGVDNEELWEVVGKVKEEDISKVDSREISLFDICRIQDNEVCFSNALAYFMRQEKYKKLWETFFGITYDVENVQTEENAKISSEEGHEEKDYNTGGFIDICIKCEDKYVLIENKIKSDVNTKASDKEITQLDRYLNYANWKLNKRDDNKYENISAYILTPNYNKPTISDEMKKHWHIITYGDLYKYLNDNRALLDGDRNFVYFFEAIKRHTHENVNDYLYYEMQEKFFNRIK